MERLAQLLDDLDDVFSTLGLARERLRTVLILFALVFAFIPLQVAGILLAIEHPPVAMATAMLMFMVLFYRTVTSAHAVGTGS